MLQDTTSVSPDPVESSQGWNTVTRPAFRFIFAYLIFYYWPGFIFDVLPFDTSRLTDWLQAPFLVLFPWVAIHVFHLSGPVTQFHETGAGDTTLGYIQVLCLSVIALVAAGIWTVCDRRREYRTLYGALRLYTRYVLALALLSYGFLKVFAGQMPEPTLSTLTETYGQSSPMHLLWTFIGASRPYEQFSGLAEVTAGALLLFRRTSKLGACAGCGVMLNVVLLNFCYDVPVKIYSTHLFLLSLFLACGDAVPIFRLFVRGEAATLHAWPMPVLDAPRFRGAASALKAALIALMLYTAAWVPYQMTQSMLAGTRRHPAIYGVWAVDVGGREDSPPTGGAPWNQLVVNHFTSVVTRTDQGDSGYFIAAIDEAKHHLKMTGRWSRDAGDFDFSQPDDAHLTLDGKMNGVKLLVKLHREKTTRFLLTSRGFHWINEDPFNR